jgi:hypothetical protein
MTKHLLALGFMLTIGSVLQAESIRHEQHQQKQRINQGIRSGELTRSEASRLYRREAGLQWRAARDRRDGGGLTWMERNKLQSQQNRLSRSIYRQKHDKQDR